MNVHVNCQPDTPTSQRIHVHACLVHPGGSTAANSTASCLWSEHDLTYRTTNRALATADLQAAVPVQPTPEMSGIAQWAVDLVSGGG